MEQSETMQVLPDNPYVLVSFPEIQDFMMSDRWDECIFCQEIEGHPVKDSTYAVPIDLYREVYKIEYTKYEELLALLKTATNILSQAVFELEILHKS